MHLLRPITVESDVVVLICDQSSVDDCKTCRDDGVTISCIVARFSAFTANTTSSCSCCNSAKKSDWSALTRTVRLTWLPSEWRLTIIDRLRSRFPQHDQSWAGVLVGSRSTQSINHARIACEIDVDRIDEGERNRPLFSPPSFSHSSSYALEEDSDVVRSFRGRKRLIN